jgi:hypothetical protein
LIQLPIDRCIALKMFITLKPGNYFQQFLISLFLTTLLNGLVVVPSTAQSQPFGQTGRSGVDGRSGRQGVSASEQAIQASQQLQTIDLSGTDGESGESASSGESAYQCQQPKETEVNLVGATGGNGGDGGVGGNGGNGGNATIYFQEPSQLKNVVLRNRGGRAGVGGNGGLAGEGCKCAQPRWAVSYCTWTLMAKPLQATAAPWAEVQQKLFRCSSDNYYNKEQYRPTVPQPDENYRYGWKYAGISRQTNFACEDGQHGEQGRRGVDGRTGFYGQVWLVQGDRIPTEQLAYSDRISQLVEKPILLLKNNWLEKTGLLSLLGNGSDVPNNYRLLQTVQGSFNVVWKAVKRPKELGDPEMKVAIAESGQLQFDIPGTLEYKLTQQPKQTLVTITDGIHPNRLGQFKFKGFDRFRDARNFSILDEGKLLPELKSTQLIISLYQDGFKVQEVSYPVTSQASSSDGVTVWDNLYKINLHDRFDSWLKAGQPAQYDIQIKQTTHAGAIYTSGMKINLIVNQVTPFPDVEYHPVSDQSASW